MKRDWAKVRGLLLHLESHSGLSIHDVPALGFQSSLEADEYMRLMGSAGFLHDLIDTHSPRDEPGFVTNGLSASGHDFLDAIRNDDAWHWITIQIEKFGGLPSGLVKDLGVQYLRRQVDA